MKIKTPADCARSVRKKVAMSEQTLNGAPLSSITWEMLALDLKEAAEEALIVAKALKAIE